MIDHERLSAAWKEYVVRGRTASARPPFFEAWETISSTNDRAAKLAAGGAPDFTMVTADVQTAGKGRRGRRWETPAGSAVAMSLVLRPKLPLEALSGVSLLAGIAVKRCLAALGASPRIKWPNDIRLDGRKVCGILAETSLREGRAEHTVLGIGINVEKVSLPDELRDIAISLEEAGIGASRELLMAQIAGELLDLAGAWEKTGDLSFIVEEYEAFLEWKNEPCRVIGADGSFTEGTILGINADGTLRFLTEAGEEAVLAGEVSLRPQKP